MHDIYIFHTSLHIYFAHKCNCTQDLSDITHDLILTDSHLLLEMQKLVPLKVKVSLPCWAFFILRQDIAFCHLKETTFLLFMQNVSICVLIMEIFMH